jgi:hypothetical protein
LFFAFNLKQIAKDYSILSPTIYMKSSSLFRIV